MQDGGHTAEVWVSAIKQTVKLDNGWVVPYNPILLLKFQCHVNVEIVGSVGAVKYLYKYITKGIPHVMVKELIAGDHQR